MTRPGRPNLTVPGARSVAEWIGASEDTPAPPRVRLRVFQRAMGCCHRCGRRIGAGERWVLEHLDAIINGGKNRESNLGVTCSWCLPDKNAEDAAEKSRVATLAKKHFGIKDKPKGRPMAGTKASGIRKRMDGSIETW